MAIFNLRRVFLPIAVGMPQAPVALRKSRFVPSRAFTLSRFQPQAAPKRRPRRSRLMATLFVAGVLFLASTARPADAGLWDDFRDSVKAWYSAFQLGEVNEDDIPQQPVELAGEVALLLKNQVELAFDKDTPGIGSVHWMDFSPEGTLLIADYTGQQALEFSRTDGRYIRSFGRQGNGPGEYGTPGNMAIDPYGRVYILDPVFGRILRYDRQGQYVDRTSLFKGSRLLTGRTGEVFLIKVNEMQIIEVQRLDPATWEPLYRIPLSTDKQRFISSRMLAFAQVCYNPARHRLYYLGPNDYLVKEIDADTGQIIRQFGHRPAGFIPLPKRYHSILRGSFEDMRELKMTTLKSMTLVDERYLFVSYRHLGMRNEVPTPWILYDLASSVNIEAYAFNKATIDSLKSFTNHIPWNSVAAWQGRLYIWREPSNERAETSNGMVATYLPVFEDN